MRPAFNHEHPLALDVLVVDEASMLDLPLVLDLLRAVPTGCRLVLLGDENQLPSVGLGAVLAALSRPTALDKETAESWRCTCLIMALRLKSGHRLYRKTMPN